MSFIAIQVLKPNPDFPAPSFFLEKNANFLRNVCFRESIACNYAKVP